MKILIATDGSNFSNAAIEECCKIVAEPKNTKIKIVSAFEDAYAFAAEPFAISAEYYQELANAGETRAGHFVADAACIIRKRFPETEMDITVDVLKGPPEREIIELAKEWGANLIVVGSHGRGFWGRMIGSVSDGVIHHAPCSVLVVRR